MLCRGVGVRPVEPRYHHFHRVITMKNWGGTSSFFSSFKMFVRWGALLKRWHLSAARRVSVRTILPLQPADTG